MNKREAGIQLVEACVAGENAQDYDRMYSVFAPKLTFHLNGAVLASGDRDVFKEGEKKTTPSTFGNARREVQWIDATNDRVVYQYRLVFDHIGEVFGVPASGGRIEVYGVALGEHDGTAISALHFFTDQGEMNRELHGKLRTPGTASAAPSGRPIPEGERARYEAVGERLIRTVYEAENERDVEKQLACYADPLLDHFAGRATPTPIARGRAMLPGWWENVPGLHREIEEVLAFGNRAVLRWHMTAGDIDGKSVSQHGCSVIEHDGERITKFWAYYPDLAQVFPAILGLE